MLEIKSKLKIGVFGGARGRTMMSVLFDHPDAQLVAVCDKYRPLLDEVKLKAGEKGVSVAVYDDFDEFIKHDMDAVVLANYANEHGIYAIKCLNAGKHVLSEVLPCETCAQAVELIEAVEKTKLVYAYAENYCYMHHTFEMWKKYKKGYIGEVMYGEGEYIHDCASIWPRITYGQRDHWRNCMHPNFYCTHSLGPLIMMSGLKPKSVTGFELPRSVRDLSLGFSSGPGIEMVTMENGAVFKSIHGHLRREPSSVNYVLYGQKGMMESGRQPESKSFNMYVEGDKYCQGQWEKYDPVNEIASDLVRNVTSHGGSDFYATHFFIEKILGRPDGEWSIDVYRAVDMGICGILGYRSVLDNSRKTDIPDFRNIKERDKYRNDNACTTPEVAKEQLLPKSSFGEPEIPDSVYDDVRQLWMQGKNAE
ncbi:MAG: Gfo/Idh/MocA family oxidoreductase [Clostridia bacterium]